MDRITAETISRKTKALKHCTKLLAKINKEGQATVRLNCTGVEFIVHKGDAMYLKLATIHAQLTEEIRSYEIVKRATTSPATATE